MGPEPCREGEEAVLVEGVMTPFIILLTGKENVLAVRVLVKSKKPSERIELLSA